MTKKTLASLPLVGALLCGVLAAACAEPTPTHQNPPPDPPAAEEAEGPPAPPICCLHAGDHLEGALTSSAAVAYVFDLAAGDVLEVLADQESADLVLTVSDSEGTPVQPWDTPVGRREPEHLLFATDSPGRFALTIQAPGAAAPAPFQLSVVALGPAPPARQSRARAAMAVASAHELRRQHDLEAAAARYAAGADAWAALEEPASEADALDWEALCLRNLNRHEEAVGALERALAGFQESGDLGREARALEDLGTSLQALGRLDDAVARFDQAASRWHQAGDLSGEASTLNRLANLQKARGDFSGAEIAYQRSIRLWEALGQRRDQAVTLVNLAGIYTTVGHAELALDLVHRAQDVLPPEADPADRAFFRGEEGVVQQRLGNSTAAAAALREALAILQDEGEGDGTAAAALDGLARIHYDAGEYGPAADLYRQALARARAAHDRVREASILESLAWVELRRGEPQEALSLFRRVLPDLRELDFPAGEVAALAGIARVERALGHTEAAATWAERSLEVLEELRSGADRSDLRASLLAGRQSYFDFAVDTLMELHRLRRGGGFAAEAFAVSERGRARWLLDALPNTGAGAEPADAPSLEPLRQAVNAAAARRLRLLADGATPEDLDQTERELRGALEDLRRGEARRATSGSPKAQTEAARKPLTVAEAQARLLDPQTLLLSYDLGEERSYLFAVTESTLTVVELPAGERLETEAGALHRLLADSDEAAAGSQPELHAASLSNDLLRRVADLVARHRRLLIIPEGALHAIPFGVLPDPETGRPLLEDHEIVQAPSASAVAWLGERPRRRARATDQELLAMIADPVFGPEDDRVTPDPDARAGSAPPESPSVMGGPELPRLPNAGEEAREILELAGPADVLSALDFEADKQLATSGALSGYRILHFATHGWFSSDYPELSALVLSRVDEHGHPKDGVLWAHEIAALDLSADLVVLSACDTGLGAEIEGEGLVGLTHAFFRAGAPRVLASLWRVDDRAAVDLMTTFYRGYLDDGLSAAEALRRAQLAVRSDPRWKRPFYWAGFVLQGRR